MSRTAQALLRQGNLDSDRSRATTATGPWDALFTRPSQLDPSEGRMETRGNASVDRD